MTFRLLPRCPVRESDPRHDKVLAVVCPDPLPVCGPVRTCVGCRERAAKAELLRVVAESGQVVPDPASQAPGRGAHVHPMAECVSAAVRRRAFPRALRVQSGLDAAALVAFVDALPSTLSK